MDTSLFQHWGEKARWIRFRICNIAYKTIRRGNNVSRVCVHMGCFGWWVTDLSQ
jgi:hypothetical protein